MGGVLLASQIHVLPVACWLILLPMTAIFIRRWRRSAITVALFLAVMLSGTLLYQHSLPKMDENSIQYYISTSPVTLTGIVSAMPENSAKTQHLRLSHIMIEQNGVSHPVAGDALLFASIYPGYRYGDELVVTGKLEAWISQSRTMCAPISIYLVWHTYWPFPAPT